MSDKQRTYDWCDKSTEISPTVTTRGLILTAAINVNELQDVATIDVTTAFFHAENNEEIIMKLRGKIIKLSVKLEPSMYRKICNHMTK